MLIWLKALNAIGGSLPCLIKTSLSLLIHSFWLIFKRIIKPGLLRSTLLRAYSKLCDRNEPSDGLPSCDPLLSGIQARDWVLQRACYPQHSSRYCLALLRHIITPVTGNRGHLSLVKRLHLFHPRLTRPWAAEDTPNLFHRYSLISAQGNCVVMSLAAGYVK